MRLYASLLFALSFPCSSHPSADALKEQQKEIAELKRRLQQQEQEQMLTVATASEIVHETTLAAEISEATQQEKVTQYDPGMFHTPSQKEKKEQQEQEVEKALRSLGRSPKEQNKNSRNKASRQRRRDFAGRVRRAEEETGVVPVARLFQSDSEEDRVPAQPVEYPGGGEIGPASSTGKRMSDREPELGGTPEAKESRLVRRVVYADIGSQLRFWQSPQRVENPYRPDPNSKISDSNCDLEGNSDWGAD